MVVILPLNMLLSVHYNQVRTIFWDQVCKPILERIRSLSTAMKYYKVRVACTSCFLSVYPWMPGGKDAMLERM